MPSEDAFCGTATLSRDQGYYATLLHELTHWSGAKHRLNREFGKRFGDKAYAAEELVAEIGAAFLCAELQITQEIRPDHAQYLAQWLELLKSDSRAIFTAAAKASEAAAYLKRFECSGAAAA
jgi:antirestriction protein ArdC